MCIRDRRKREAEAKLDVAKDELKYRKAILTKEQVDHYNQVWQSESEVLRNLMEDSEVRKLFQTTPLHRGKEKMKKGLQLTSQSLELTQMARDQSGKSSRSALEAPSVPVQKGENPNLEPLGRHVDWAPDRPPKGEIIPLRKGERKLSLIHI